VIEHATVRLWRRPIRGCGQFLKALAAYVHIIVLVFKWSRVIIIYLFGIIICLHKILNKSLYLEKKHLSLLPSDIFIQSILCSYYRTHTHIHTHTPLLSNTCIQS